MEREERTLAEIIQDGYDPNLGLFIWNDGELPKSAGRKLRVTLIQSVKLIA